MEDIIAYLIPLIFILAYLFPKAKKKVQTEAKQTGTTEGTLQEAKSGGIFGKLNKMLEEYYEDDSEEPKGRKARVDPFELGDEPYQVDLEFQEQEPEEVEKKIAKVEVDEEEKPEPEKKPGKVSLDAADTLDSSKSTVSNYQVSATSKQDLRKAVIWSEILGPPVALKDK